MRFLANENFPSDAVLALRNSGHDVAWIRTESPGNRDEEVIQRARDEQRIILTFDKDFGELVFKLNLPAECGIILFRILMPSANHVAHRVVQVLSSREDWSGYFSVIEDNKIRMRPLF